MRAILNVQMITEAIVSLKERTGSSQVAIAKFIEEKQKANLPSNFRNLLLVQLKRLVANEKLVKVKNSFKLPPRSLSTTTSAVAVKKPKPATEKKKSVSAKTAKPKTDGKKKPAVASKAKTTKPEAKKSTAAAKSKKPAKPAVKKTAAATKAKKTTKPEAKKAVAATKAKKPKTITSPGKKAEKKKGKK